MEDATSRLDREALSDITWLEDALRECVTRGALDVLLGLLSSPDLVVPGDEREEGERCVGRVPRELHTLFGSGTILRRGYIRDGEKGRYPMDNALGLIHGVTPRRASLLCRAAARSPFKQAAEDLKAYTGLEVPGRQLQRLSQEVGPCAEDFLRREVLPERNTSAPRVYVMMDGTGAPLRKMDLIGRLGKGPEGEARTHEVKVAALFTQHPRPGEDPWRDLDTTTYVATDKRVDDFGSMVRNEFRRRFSKVGHVVVIGDGAPWIDGIEQGHFQGATRIIDWHHAVEHLGDLAEVISPRGSKEWEKLRKRWIGKLWNGKVAAILRDARKRFPPEASEQGEKQLGYFAKRKKAMRYDVFREQGMFIGSGVVEAACKTLVGQRFKSSGMHWSQVGLHNLLSIRTALLSNRFEEFWAWMAHQDKAA